MGNTSPKEKCVSCLKSNVLTLLTVFGVIAGVILGISLRSASEEPWTAREIMYINFVGELFLRMLKALILPLIVSSLISAIGGLDLSLSGRIGALAVGYYMATTVFAVILGIILVTAIHPGTGHAEEISREGSSRNVTTPDTLMDLVRNMFPPNLVEAAVYQYRTVLTPPSKDQAKLILERLNRTQNSSEITLYEWEIGSEWTRGTNILGLVVFSVIFGITIGKMKTKGAALLNFFSALAEAMMSITNIVIWLSPFGVLFLIASQVLKIKDFGIIVGQLGMYFFTVLLGIFLHGFIILPILFTLVTRKLPFKFIGNMMQALITAFGTASSSATLPLTIQCLEDKNGIDPRVARFVLPIGATINMDGTALYEAVAAIFIAQVRGFSLSVGNIVAISITATAASIGAAGIPQAGLVTMVMVLDTVGLPAEDVTLIIAVDWLLDRFRTMINVLGDSLGAGLVAHLSRNDLQKMGGKELQGIQSDWEKANGENAPNEEVATTAM